MAINNRQSREIGDIGYRRRKTKTIKAKNTTQYVLDTTIQKTQDKDKKTKKKKNHNTICSAIYEFYTEMRGIRQQKQRHIIDTGNVRRVE